jgi:hypothetical protein
VGDRGLTGSDTLLLSFDLLLPGEELLLLVEEPSSGVLQALEAVNDVSSWSLIVASFSFVSR